MAYTDYIKLRILHYHFQGLRPYTIAKVLDGEGIRVSLLGVHKFLIVYNETGSIARRPGSGRLPKVTAKVKALVDNSLPTPCTKCLWRVKFQFLSELFFAVGHLSDGHSAGLRTVN